MRRDGGERGGQAASTHGGSCRFLHTLWMYYYPTIQTLLPLHREITGIWLEITHLLLNPPGGIKEVEGIPPTFCISHLACDFISEVKLGGSRGRGPSGPGSNGGKACEKEEVSTASPIPQARGPILAAPTSKAFSCDSVA